VMFLHLRRDLPRGLADDLEVAQNGIKCAPIRDERRLVQPRRPRACSARPNTLQLSCSLPAFGLLEAERLRSARKLSSSE
jgi:hypothetical protein